MLFRSIHSYDYFKNLKDVKLKKGLKVHLKIDSGFNRLGIDDKNQVKEIADYLHENKNIIFEGIFSHFATSGVADKEWDNQVESFLEITSLINLDDIPIRHFAKSNALVNHPKLTFCNGCRLGLIMYGYDETTILSSSFKDKLRKFKLQLKQNSLSISTTNHVCVDLKPCFSLHTTVIQSKLLKKGEKLGYGAFYQANEDQYISILPIGYADGFKRTNNLGKAIVNNEEVQIIGGIMMGMITIKTNELLDEGAPVTLIGGPVSVKEVARRNQTTIYETLCSFNSYIPRVYYKCGVNVETEEKEGI